MFLLKYISAAQIIIKDLQEVGVPQLGDLACVREVVLGDLFGDVLEHVVLQAGLLGLGLPCLTLGELQLFGFLIALHFGEDALDERLVPRVLHQSHLVVLRELGLRLRNELLDV